MNCPYCNGLPKKNGKDRDGNQRFMCKECGKTYIEKLDKPLDEMRLERDKAILCLKLLVEGNSIRSTERIANVHRDTILRLLEKVGKKCEKLHYDLVQGMPINNLEADEIWAFVGMKQKTANKQGLDENDKVGSTYTFTSIEGNSKMIVAWHLGKRTEQDALIFLEKIYEISKDTNGRFQMSTDGWRGYDHTVNEVLPQADYGQVIKIYGQPNPEQVRYSGSEVIEIKKRIVAGNPNLDSISTSYVERQNLTMRMSMRRMTRLTNGFSKKFENLGYAIALHFAYYNYCRVHKTLRCTPAMAADITKSVWEIEDLYDKLTQYSDH